MEKPPDENCNALSGKPIVAPTEVTKGQPEGKVGTKSLHFSFSSVAQATPPSPELTRTETPRAPSCMNALQS